MKISFICALFNRRELTENMLSSLIEHTSLDGHEVLLVDNASNDGTWEMVQALGAPFSVVRNHSNVGFAAANNQAATRATGDVLVFVNNDLVLTPNWLEPMLDGLALDQVGAVGNVQINPRTKLIDHAGVYFDLEGMPSHARKHRRRIPRAEFKEWNAVTAACIAMTRTTFLDAGCFDTAYRNGMEDIDLCVRLRLRGQRLVVANRSVIYHHVSSSPGRKVHDDENSRRFRRTWAATTAHWGAREWPAEYLQRYARRPWKMTPTRFCRALWLLMVQFVSGRVPRRAVHGH